MFFVSFLILCHKGPEMPCKKVERKGGLRIERVYDHQFAKSGNSIFHLQVCKFNGNLQYGLTKFFRPNGCGQFYLRLTIPTVDDLDDNSLQIPTKSNCWMSPSVWNDFVDCVEQTANRLEQKNLKLGMYMDIL